MPWQAAPSLIIIFGAFNVAAGLIWTVDRAYYGKVCYISVYFNLTIEFWVLLVLICNSIYRDCGGGISHSIDWLAFG